MSRNLDVEQVARALQVSFALLKRQLRQVPVRGELTPPEASALARLDRGGPSTSAALARLEQISPQSMGATLAALERRGLVERRRDPEDGRQVVISVSEEGLEVLRGRGTARTDQLTTVLSSQFTPSELEQLLAAAPLIERIAQAL